MLVHLVQNALHVVVADPGTRKGGKGDFLIGDPADGGAVDEVADLEMQRKITLVLENLDFLLNTCTNGCVSKPGRSIKACVWKLFPVHLVVGPEARSAGIDSTVRGAVGWRSESIGWAAEEERSSVGRETHQEQLSWCSQFQPVGHGRVLRDMTCVKRMIYTLASLCRSNQIGSGNHGQTYDVVVMEGARVLGAAVQRAVVTRHWIPVAVEVVGQDIEEIQVPVDDGSVSSGGGRRRNAGRAVRSIGQRRQTHGTIFSTS